MSVRSFPSNATTVNTQITQLRQAANTDLSSNQELLQQQNTLKELIENEKQSLQSKVDTYDKISETSIRDALLKKNSSQRLKQHNYIFFIIIFAIALLILIEIIEKYYSFILPEWILNLARIIIISVTIIWCFTLNEMIQYRDNLNYDRIDLEKPVIDTPAEQERKRQLAAKEGDLLGTLDNTCRTGAELCGTGTTWDSERMLCMPSTTSSSTTSSSTSNTETFNNILPNEPCCNYISV